MAERPASFFARLSLRCWTVIAFFPTRHRSEVWPAGITSRIAKFALLFAEVLSPEDIMDMLMLGRKLPPAPPAKLLLKLILIYFCLQNEVNHFSSVLVIIINFVKFIY